MIDDAEVERALDYLRDSSLKMAQARGERIYAEEYRKSLKAILASHSNESSEAAKDRAAYTHERYLEHLDRIKQAVINDEEQRALRVAAEMKIEVWRSQQANIRSMKV